MSGLHLGACRECKYSGASMGYWWHHGALREVRGIGGVRGCQGCIWGLQGV